MSKSQKNLAPLPFTQLFGDTEENFYQLGIKDRERHNLILESIKYLTKTPWNIVDKFIEELIKGAIDKALPLHPEYKRLLTAYAEGLNRKASELAYVYLIPEFISALNRWVPGLPTTLFGCSTYIARDSQSGEILHGRILDFPLQGSFDVLERATLYAFNKRAKIFSYGTLGMPFPSITCMNEHGLTLALHQKFSNHLSSTGIPIFYLVFEMMSHCRDLQDVRELLKKSRSVTTWGLYLTHKSGDLLAADITPHGLHEKQLQLKDGDVIYLGNRTFDESIRSEDIMPWGLNIYNQNREDLAEIKAAQLKKKKNLGPIELLTAMGTQAEQKIKKSEYWKIDPLTPATIQNCVMNASSGTSYFIPGRAPKFMQEKLLEFSDLWNRPTQKMIDVKNSKFNSAVAKGYHALMEAQVRHDKDDIHGCYHYCQLAIDFLNNRPEEAIARFYFSVFQFMHEEHQKMLAHLLTDFKQLKGKLSPYLEDHRQLFVMRLERLLKLNISISIDQIENTHLKKIYEFEQKWKPQIVFSALRKLTNPRIEIFDIIYAHVKSA